MYFFNASFFAFLAIIASAFAIPHSRLTDEDITGCNRACPDIYLPVCGYNKMEYKIFANDCDMESVNCIQQVRHNNVFMAKSMDLCEKNVEIEAAAVNVDKKSGCNKACTLEYNPICGFDGRSTKTYGNMCMFETANCESDYKLRITRHGECSEVPEVNAVEKNCDRICPATYIPVCGFDGKSYTTYANTCQFDIMNCMADNHLRMVQMEECPQENENVETKEVKNCVRACPDTYIPVCGFDGKSYTTYSNMCMFEAANCESDNKLRVTRNGECSEVAEVNAVEKNCLRACPDTYIPVCGFDGKSYTTYSNMCMFEAANCESDNKLRIARNGECSEVPEVNAVEKNCLRACPDTYIPVCGFDGKSYTTYSNMCMFEAANCESDNKLRITRNGECSEVPEVNAVEKNCDRICPATYIPVCGFDGKSYTTYANTCQFDIMNCMADNHLRMVEMGECSQEKVNVETNEVKNCDRVCPNTYIPVCAFDGKNYETYANPCQFNIRNCYLDNKLRMVQMGECPKEKVNVETNKIKNDCNKACTLEYNPICGFDGHSTKTYGNMCMFKTANCESNYELRITRIGECQDEIPPVKEIKLECIRPCPASYLPVCGFDGENYHTYGNTCEFEMMNCDSENHLRMVRKGEC